jgi:hypothetical protein
LLTRAFSGGIQVCCAYSRHARGFVCSRFARLSRSDCWHYCHCHCLAFPHCLWHSLHHALSALVRRRISSCSSRKKCCCFVVCCNKIFSIGNYFTFGVCWRSVSWAVDLLFGSKGVFVVVFRRTALESAFRLSRSATIVCSFLDARRAPVNTIHHRTEKKEDGPSHN